MSAEAERELDALARRYPQRRPRADLAAVERLRDAAPIGHVTRHVVVVGTNGKTSTATYLARLLTLAGARTGLVTSPHIASWGERVRVDDEPLPVAELAERVGQLAAFAGDPEAAPDLRFFDLLTLACEALLADAGVDVAVVEAGLGGRLDASRTLLPKLVVLTGIDLDHTELLGPTREHILIEKLAVAPPGALVLAGGLDDALAARAAEEAERLGVRLELVEPETPGGDGPPAAVPPGQPAARPAGGAASPRGARPARTAGDGPDHARRAWSVRLARARRRRRRWSMRPTTRRPFARCSPRLPPRPAGSRWWPSSRSAPTATRTPWRRPCATPRRSARSWPRPSTRGPRAVPARSLRPSRGPACRSRWSPIRRSPGATRCSTRGTVDGVLVAFGSAYLLGELPPLQETFARDR